MSKHRTGGLKTPNEDLVRTLCNPKGEVTRSNGKTYLLFECPHPYCNHRSGKNIISQEKNIGFSSAASHLKTCVGRDSMDTLNQLVLRINERPGERDQILSDFQDQAANRKESLKLRPPENNTNRKRKQPYGILTENEMKDARTAVEHILMVGSNNRHDMMRRQQFRASHEGLLEMEHERPLDVAPVNPFGPVEHPDNNLFAEDVRIYGEQCTTKSVKTEDRSPMPAWPRKLAKRETSTRKKCCIDDKEWDIEHGDTINTLAFSIARLSGVIPDEKDRAFMDGRNRLIDTTEIGVSNDQVPRALLLRCWERAVHAASCVTHVPKVPNEAPPYASNPSPSSGKISRSLYEAEQDSIALTMKATRAKCMSLGFRLGSLPHENFTCPVCSAKLDNTAQLESHFYGGRQEKLGSDQRQVEKSQIESIPVRGCCWAVIKEEHLSLINSALQKHIQTQAELLLGTIMAKAKEMVPDTRSAKTSRLMNWHDILAFVGSALESSKRSSIGDEETKARNPVLEGLETKSTTGPVFLNPAILEVVRERLISRYADVAR